MTQYRVTAALIVAALAIAPASLAAQQSSAKDSADSFRLDSLEPGKDAASAAEAAPDRPATLPDPTVDDTATVTHGDASATDHADTPAATKLSWLDVPIGSLIANPTTRRVLDKDLPGLSSDSNLPKFQQLTLREFQPMTGGQLTDELLSKVEKDLEMPPPLAKGKARRNDR